MGQGLIDCSWFLSFRNISMLYRSYAYHNTPPAFTLEQAKSQSHTFTESSLITSHHKITTLAILFIPPDQSTGKGYPRGWG